MALGLGLVALGGVLVWQGTALRPLPGLSPATTPFSVPLDGPLPLDLAGAATVRLSSTRGNLSLQALAADSPDLVRGQAEHRAQNPLELDTRRIGREVTFSAWLNVPDLGYSGVVVQGPPPFQHQLRTGLTRQAALTLKTETVGGNQDLNLAGLRLRSVTARSDSGKLDLTLPALPGGPYAVVTRSGAVTLRTLGGARPEAVRVNSRTGTLNLDLAGAAVEALGAGTGSGAVVLTLPHSVSRGSVTTTSGPILLSAHSGTRGNLDIRTQSGRVSLRVAPDLRVRVRFPDRETLLLPEGAPPLPPALDLFVDAPAEQFVWEVGP